MGINNKWAERQIGEDCFVGDGAHAKIPRQNAGIMYLTSKNFKSDGLDLTKIDYISEDYFKKYFKDNSKASKKPIAEDVLFSIIGTIGEPYLVKEQDYFGISSSVAILRPNKSVLFPKYLYYWIKGHILQSALYGIKSGVAQGFVSLEMIKSLPLWYPPLPTQHKITAILSAYDDLIENNMRRIKILEEMAQALYREWFVNFRFPEHETVKMVESELGMVPEGWEVRQIQDICSKINSGGTPARQNDTFWRNGEFDWFKTKELQDGFLFSSEEKISKDGLEKSSTKILPENTIVMAIYAAPTVGRLGILTHPSCFNQAAVGLVANPKVSSSRFLYYKLFEMRAYFNLISRGAAQQNINVQKVKEAKIALPSINLIKNFDTFVDPVLNENKNLTMKNANLRRTRDLLLPKLISGEVDVENLDINISKKAT